MQTPYRARWRWIVPLLLLAFGLGARMLNGDALWLDEHFSLQIAGVGPYGPLSPAEIWTRTANDAGLGVLYYWTLSVWALLTGPTQFSGRALSLLIGMLAVAWTYRLGAALFSRRVGFYALAIMVSSALFADYLHELRAYTQFALVTAFTLWAYWKLAHAASPPQPWRYALLILGLAALLYTHYVGVIVAGGLGAYHLLLAARTRRWWWIALAIGAAGLLYLPWLTTLLGVIREGAQDVIRQGSAQEAGEIIEALASTFSNGSVGLLLLVGAYALRERSRGAGFLAFVLVIGLAGLLVVNAAVPFLIHIRYTLAWWPLLAALAAVGIARMAQARINPALVLLIWMGVGIWQDFRPAFTQSLNGAVYQASWPALTAALDILQERARPDDLALLHVNQIGYEELNSGALDYLLYETYHLPLRYDQFERMNNTLAYSDAGYLIDVQESIGDAPFIWTVKIPTLPFTQRSRVVNRYLAREYGLCATLLDRPDIQAQLYARPPQRAADATYTTPQGRSINLYRLLPMRIGEALEVTLGWSLEAGIPQERYTAALHVDNAAGEFVAQADYALPAAPFGCHTARIGLDALPAGDYTLYVMVYNWRTGERLPGQLDGQSGERLPLADFTLSQR